MSKMLISLLCLLLCTACGGALAGELKKRREVLETLSRDIRSIRTWAAFDRLPLRELFHRLENSGLYPLWQMAAEQSGKGEERFEAHWRSCVCLERRGRLSCLAEEETQLLLEFGIRLVASADMDAQLRQIDRTLEHLDGCIKEARETEQKKSRLIRSLGAMGGLAITIILW